jgi:biopolymer transport protein ExbB
MTMFAKIWGFFVSGGVFMIPLSLCSLVSLMFIIERGMALRRSRILPEELVQAILNLRAGDPPQGLANQAAPGTSTLARLVRVCLEHLPWSKAENVEAVQTRARREITQMERGLIVLEIITGIGPLLGLLGTVSGLVTVFGGIASTGLDIEGIIIARGIAEALNTTVAGLVIAIPSLIAHAYYTKRVESLAVEMESLCMDLLAKLYLTE